MVDRVFGCGDRRSRVPVLMSRRCTSVGGLQYGPQSTGLSWIGPRWPDILISWAKGYDNPEISGYGIWACLWRRHLLTLRASPREDRGAPFPL